MVVDEGWMIGMGLGAGLEVEGGLVLVLVVLVAFLARDLAFCFWIWRETKDQKRAASEGGDEGVWVGCGVGTCLIVGAVRLVLAVLLGLGLELVRWL